MRLRLAIHRHGLPPAQILWSTDGLRPNHHASGPNTTVAQFLDQINEVVPLEAEEWGLEDYVVEVGGFECVHYSIVNQILKDEDQVTIRPLQHGDRRYLRVSGRHQISADGRHLIDGVAFGRPFIRRAERPPVRIPSTKRPRLVYDNDQIDDLQVNGTNQLVLRESSDDEHELEFDGAGFDEDDGGEEVDDTGHPGLLEHTTGSMHLENGKRYSQRLSNPRKRRRAGLGIESQGLTPPGQATYGTARRKHRESTSPSKRSSRSSTKSVRFEGNTLETPATVLAEEESDEEDTDFDPEAADSEESESNKENVDPASEDSQEKSDVPSDETSSSGSSDSDSESDTSSSGSESTSGSSSLTSSLSSSDSEVSSSSVEENSKFQPETSAKAAPPSAQSTETPKRGTDAISEPQSAPGQGKRQTKKRNERRKARARAARLEALNDTPDAFKGSETVSTPHNHAISGKEQDEVENLANKKLALLQAIEPEAEQSHPLGNASNDYEVQSGEALIETSQFSPQPPNLDNQLHQEPQSQNVDEERPNSHPRRSRLDTASTKRLIFGSLGLRTPKTKEEEDTLRRKLSANVQRPVQNAQANGDLDSSGQVNYSDSSWKNMVDSQGVECCYDDVELSTPPFPFVQRWDPQQQDWLNQDRRKRRNAKNKRRRRNNSQYYQEDENFEDYKYEYGQTDYPNYQTLPYDDNTGERDDAAEQIPFDGNDLSTNGAIQLASETDSIQAAVNRQLLEDTNSYPTTVEASTGLDLPDLPTDLSLLEVLSAKSAKPGAIIAFKQLDMSEKTNWCPIISSYRTAKVNEVLDDAVLNVTLASRDVQRKEKRYDPETGERVYDRFEMPSDNEESDLDESRLELSLLDMIEPKIVMSAEAFYQPSSSQDAMRASSAAADATYEELEESFQSDEDSDVLQMVTDRGVGKGYEDVSAKPAPNLTSSEVDTAESARREYSLLMRDAGFRPEVDGNVNKNFLEGSGAVVSQARAVTGKEGGDEGEDEVEKKALENTPSASAPRSISKLASSPLTTEFEGHVVLGPVETLDTQPQPASMDVEHSVGDAVPAREPLEAEKNHQAVAVGDEKPASQSYSHQLSLNLGMDRAEDSQEVEYNPVHPRSSSDPDIFPLANQFSAGPNPASSSPFKTELLEGEQGKPATSPINGSSSFPSPGHLLSQPNPRTRKVDEDWDAEYLPPSTAPAGNRKVPTRAAKGKDRPARRTKPKSISSSFVDDTFEQSHLQKSEDEIFKSALDDTTEIPTSPPAINREAESNNKPKPETRSRSSKARTSSSENLPDRIFPSIAPTVRTTDSQVIDLTLSSDIEERPSSSVSVKEEEEEEASQEEPSGSLGLPKGPGWIVKRSRARFNRGSYSPGEGRNEGEIWGRRTRSVI